MPKKYQPRSRKPYSKPTVAKAKKVVTTVRKAKAKKNMDTFFLKATSLFNVVPQQGVYAANYVYGMGQLLGGNLLTNAEFKFYSLQYDKFRVNSVTVAWTPKANVLDQASAQDDSKFNLTGDGMIHTCIDRDGQPPAGIAAFSRYPSYRKYSIMKKWSRTYATKYPLGMWLDCQDPAGNDQIIASLGLGGSVSWYAENFLEDNYEIWNEPIAEMSISWNIVFQGKTSASLDFATDESGNVTGVTLKPYTTPSNPPLTPLTNVRGTIADTRTTDEVTEVPITDQGLPKV